MLTVASEIAGSLFTSTAYETSPYRSDLQYVADLYYAYLQRGPDDSGLNWWAEQVPGSGRANVCNAFEASSEFATLVATLYGTATSDNERTEHFVNNFYLGALGRNATATELQQQRDALNAAAAQGPSQVQAQAETFGRSLFAAQVNDVGLSNTQFVTNLYEGFLQRGPDAGGLGFWSGQASVGPGRQNVLNAFATCPPFYELAGTLYREAFWLVADRLGTPRMIANKSGSLAGVKRHDYLPFGEELSAGIGGRTTTQGYTGDSVRQKFTGYEADAETGLNFAQARYQSNIQGRFTSVDPLEASADVGDPQSFNRYSYVLNNPVNFTDPSGLMTMVDASMNYGEVSGMWAGGSSFNFGGPRTQNHIAEAMARHDSIISTGYDPAFGVYRGDVEVEYINDFTATTTLHNPTPDELGQTMDFMANSSDLVAQRGGGRKSGGPKASSPRTDPKNWRAVPTRRGRTEWRYTGPVSWSEGHGRARTAPSFRGLVQNRPIRDLTDHQIRNAFRDGFGFYLGDHAVIQLRSQRTYDLGMRTLNDWANHFNNAIRTNGVSPGREGRIEFSYGRYITVIAPGPLPTIVTFTLR